MSIYKDNVTGKWRVVYRYTDWTGKTKQTSKRGFPTKREAQMWEHEQMLKHDAKLDMTFASFYEIYVEDKKERIRDNTWGTKNNIARTKILPYFGERKIAEIEPKDVIAWQNHLLAFKRANGKGYSASYLRKIHSQLSAIFNHAVDFYHLPSNPAQKAGNIAIEEYKEMLFWTKEEYLKFADVMMDKPVSYYAFEMLYWCGIREGELLALTPADFDFTTHTLLTLKPVTMTVTTETGETKTYHKVYFTAVMNLKYEGGGFNFCPAASGTDDRLDIITVSELTRLKVLCLLPTAFKGWHTRFRGITLDTCTEVTITSDRALPVHTDGEPVFLQSDIHVHLEKEKLRIITPCK